MSLTDPPPPGRATKIPGPPPIVDQINSELEPGPVVLNPDQPPEPMPLPDFLPERIVRALLLGPNGTPGLLDPQGCYGDPHAAANLIGELVELLREQARDNQ